MKKVKNFLLFFVSLIAFTSISQVSNYTFSTTTGTYTDITGATSLAAASGSSLVNSIDDYVYTVTPSPSFSFYFNGVAYSTFYVSSNGFITFGSTATTTNYTPISSAATYAGSVSAFGKDINAAYKSSGITNGSLSWVVTGTAPNRTLTFQWKNFREAANTSTTNVSGINFQIQLVESSNVVRVIYGSFGNLAGSTTTAGTCQVGLRGSSSSDYNNRTSTTSWATTSAGGSSVSSMSYTPWTLIPSSGRIYTWTPPATVVSSVTSLTAFSACANVASTSQSFTVNGYSLSGNITVTAPTGFQVSTDNSTFSSSVTLTQSGGLVNSTTVYARMSAQASSPTSGNITCASTGATTVNVAVSGVVNNTGPSITTNPSNSSIVVGSNTTFSIVSSGSPTSYTWQVSTDGGTNWTTISNGGVYSGATTATLTLTAPSITMSGYKYKASATNCVTTSSYSTVATLTVNYCTPVSSGNSYYINSFSTSNGVTNISNSGTTTSATSAGYSNYSATISCSQYANTSLSFVATTNASLGGGFALWVDWNSDGTFAASERMYTSNSNGLTTTGTQSFTVPSGQALGSYRMRIAFDYNASNPTSCPSTGSIEVEDYTLTVVAPSTPTITSLGSSIGCVGTNLVINGTNLSGVSASNVTIGGTAVSSIVSNTGTVLTVVVGSGTSGTIQVVTAGGTATSSSSFTINQLPTLSYAGSPYSYSQNVAISNLTPSTTGSPSTFSSSPTLPTGLSINGSTGVISGTPSSTQSATTYTITGTNGNSCSNTTTISIAITPQNSTCANAITLTCGTNTSGSTSGTTGVASGIPTASTYGSGVSDYGVWYKINGDNSTYTLTVTPSSGYDIEIDVISGSCGTYTTVTSDDSYASGSAETVTFTANQGTTYYVYLAHYLSGSTTTGTFTINTSASAATPSVITGTSSVCPSITGLSYSVTNVSGYTYNWTIPSGFTQTGGSNTNSITLTSGTSSGSLSVTATNSCGTSSSSSITLTVKDAPTGVSAGSDGSICLGSSSNLSGTANNVNTNLVTLSSSADFATTTDNGSWSYVNSSNAGGSAYELRYIGSLTSGNVNKYLQGPSTLSGSGASTITLTFKSMVDWYTGTFTLKFQTSTDGTTWNDRWSISPTADVAASTVTVNLASDIGTTFYYRFLFSGNKYNINYWYIDDIVIGATFPPTYSWSPTSDLSSSSIYNPTATPSTTTVYTLTATANGCSVTDDVQITVNQPSASSINTSIGSSLSNGDYVWNGSSTTSWDTSVNWYTYTGSYFTTVSSNPTSSSNVYIVPGSVTQCISSVNSPILATNDVINNLYIGSSSSLDLSSNTLSIGGNVTSNGLIYGTGTIKLNGTSTQTITGSGNIIFPNMEVDKSSGSITLSVPLTVSNTLTMTNGNINNSSNIIEVGSSTSNLGSINWTSGKISGPLKRWFGTSTNSSQASGIFPIGNSFLNRYAQINFTSAPTTGGYIIGKYLNGVPSTQNTGLPLTATGQIVDNYEDEGYWELTPYSSSNVSYGALNTATYTVTLRGNTLTTVSDYTLTRIIKTPGPSHTSWEACGTHNGSVGSNSDFNITSTGVTGFSWFNIANPPSSALPVELISFSVNCESDNVVIDWQTASEYNTSYFTIERSRDGLQWDVIGTVGAAGNSNQLISYSYSDKTMGLSYYRLNQIDLDGVVKHYGPISSNCSTGSYFTTFPNPSGLSFSILINDENLLGECNVVIVDEMGKSVIVKMVDVKSGINLITMDAYDLKPGVYFISISNNNYTTDIIKQSIK
jgi:hypothetical protein